ncbi:aldose 1-epimerase [Paraglaciecola mesophila KMM 241]|uniref:Aldose 1-epimerase n=1 Tax=Paraglaciecola mesophila KMM 241 TaxID=1128912 RepID=K6XVP5_9ALTE|nr:aldose epimerase family protein [Paraglaciecola mesophila]GAC24689.1 aldose 1-epimerase [Paraglaciecola mesophila KMM 241]
MKHSTLLIHAYFRFNRLGILLRPFLFIGSCCLLCLPALLNAQEGESNVVVTQEVWGQYEGEEIKRFTLSNQYGMRVSVTNWGAYVTSIVVPDKQGAFEDVMLGYDSADEYVHDCCYNGATVGRFANRIAGGHFRIDGKPVQLSVKRDGGNKGNHAHGGEVGFNKKLWHARQVRGGVEMRYLSLDGEEGYPGNANVTVLYRLNANNEFTVSFSATSDKTTPVNLISHIYFNLSGNQKRDIEQHKLRVDASDLVQVKKGLLPTGKLMRVEGTPFDLTIAATLHERLTSEHEQLKLANGQDKTHGGFDHTWVFNRYDGKLQHQVQLYEPDSGRVLDILTTQPGVHVYTGNFMNGSPIGKQGKAMTFRSGVALETQHFADSVNQPQFPSTLLRPGETFSESTVYRFGSRQ